MNRNLLLLSATVLLTCLVALSSCGVEDYPYLVDAASIEVDIKATAGPWEWVNGGLNTDYQYDYTSGTTHTPPVVVDRPSGLLMEPGNTMVIEFVRNNNFSGGDGTDCDIEGDFSFTPDYLSNPAKYIDESERPVRLVGLVGVFTDANGALVSRPFKLTNTPREVTVPAGASRLQFGTNDGMYSDNGGSITIRVSEYAF